MAGSVGSGGDRRSTRPDSFPQDGLPQKPAKMPRDQAKIWKNLIEHLPGEILRKVDVHCLTILCVLIVRERHLAGLCREDPSNLAANRAHIAVAQAIGKLSVKFGLSPLHRRAIKMAPKQTKGEAEAWAES